MRHLLIIFTTHHEPLLTMSTDQVREEGLEGHIPSSKEDALQEDSSNSSATLQIEEREAGAQDDEKQYPEGLKLGLIILALCLAVFLLALEFVCICHRESYH